MKPYYWAILTAVVWGCVPALEKLGLSKIPVLPGLFYRSLGVLLGAIIIFAFKFSQIKEIALSGGGWAYLIIGGFLASFVGQLLFYNALKHGEASRVVPVAAAYPLVSFIIAVVLLGEKLTIAKTGGLVCVILGVILLG